MDMWLNERIGRDGWEKWGKERAVRGGKGGNVV